MVDVSPVFKQTRESYIERINTVAMNRVAEALGFVPGPQGYAVRLFDRVFIVGAGDIVDAAGRPAPFDVCVLLSRYIIMCPEAPDTRRDWTAFRDFRDAGPLLKYFADNVEGSVAGAFRGNAPALAASAEGMGSRPADGDFAYDVACRFEALPRIGLLLLFNDADAEFGAECRVLFERRAERYLDMECVAILAARSAAGLCRSGAGRQ